MYSETTEVNQVALEGFPSSAPLFVGAACAGDTGFDWIPSAETDTVPAGMAKLCRSCPAQGECLAWALSWDAEGYWGGTTTATKHQNTTAQGRRRCTDAAAAAEGARMPKQTASARSAPETEGSDDHHITVGTASANPSS